MLTLLAQLTDKINTAPIDPTPSDNIYMENIFPDEVYQEILMRLPTDEDYVFIQHPDAVLPDGTVTRKLLSLTDEMIQGLNPKNQSFWQQIKEVFTSKAFLQAVTQKFHTQIQKRYGNQWPEMELVPVFYRDFPGYRIGIHTDADWKVATLQFYFARDYSQIHLGTSFHERRNNEFFLTKTNVFKPNSAYAFVRTDSSWHSVAQLGAHETVRDTLALTVYVKDHEEYRKALRFNNKNGPVKY